MLEAYRTTYLAIPGNYERRPEGYFLFYVRYMCLDVALQHLSFYYLPERNTSEPSNYATHNDETVSDSCLTWMESQLKELIYS